MQIYIVKNNTRNLEDDFWKIKKYWPQSEWYVNFLILLKKNNVAWNLNDL